MLAVALRITTSDHRLEPVRVTVQEGLSVIEIAEIFEESLPEFDKTAFVLEARDKEGYLFPDTYLFLPNVTPGEIIAIMQDNFERKFKTIEDRVGEFGKTPEQVVVMASLLEREARTLETRRMISGILWQRYTIGMALQVDAVFEYINGKNTYELNLKDLEIDSPYNTYRYAGLPPGPIANPSLDSLIAAVTPIKSNYLFYLNDSEGVMHYAATHDEHVLNKEKYLR